RRPDDAVLAAPARGRARSADRAAVLVPRLAPAGHRGGPRGARRGWDGRAGAGVARRAVRDQRGPAQPWSRHGGDRAGVLPARALRAGLRCGVRVRPWVYVAVRLGAADSGGGSVATLPDDLCGLG